MLTLDAIIARRAVIDASADLTALRRQLAIRALPLLVRMPPVPAVKALFSRDGGVCPDDATTLAFDPWNPDQHRCPTCGQLFSGPRHHAHWARAQHLWLAERAAHLATLFALTEEPAAAARAREILAAYYDLYFALPNRDNVLGPSHLFFSTYLESIWILDYLAAAFLLREMNALDDADLERIDAIANEAATIIAEFNEGMSNRQTWNSAALTAIATWFGDEELAVSAIEGRTGLLGHLADGFGSDGMWFEGENYHLFALRGLLVGLTWAATAGAELLDDPAVAAHLGHALMAPAVTSLPDLTFPARKDARFGVSLAHPAYIECWEAGYACLTDRAPEQLAPWLSALYDVAPQEESIYDAYLHEAGERLLPRRGRAELSWWALLTMVAELPPPRPWHGESRLMEQQQLAIIRRGSTYLSMECGGGGSGHGHPDRLHLTLHANGVYWLPDPGTGSYTTRDLFWYRSTLAHNAPLLNGRDQPARDLARCVAFDTNDDWSWVVGEWGEVRRSIIVSSRWVVDMVRLDSSGAPQLDLPWHLAGGVTVDSTVPWVAASLPNEFVSDVEMLNTDSVAGTAIAARSGDAILRLWMQGDGELLRATGPGLPGRREQRQFYLRRAEQNSALMVTVIDLAGTVSDVALDGGTVTVSEGREATTVQVTGNEAVISSGNHRATLSGAVPGVMAPVSFVRDAPLVTAGEAAWVNAAPAIDGTLAGFDLSAPLLLDDEHQYFRSEAPYPGAEEFSAAAYVNWSDDALYVAIDVTKPDLIVRARDAAPLNLDNESDDINSDSVQLYWRDPSRKTHGALLSPAPDGTLQVRALRDDAPGLVTGAWTRTSSGYRITTRVHCPDLVVLRKTETVAFDLIVNEMHADRLRRAGQLIWSGGPGWVYLRGDRHDVSAFGELRLTG